MSETALHLGDCLDILPQIASRSVDMILADMPYGTTRCAWDSQIDLQRLWPELRRICRGAILLFAQAPFDKALASSNLPMFRHEWIWQKTNATGHFNARCAPLRAHEIIMVFGSGRTTYNPQKTSGHPRKTATKRRDVTSLYGAQKFDALSYDSTERFPRSVLTFPSDKQRSKLHPTQKPLALCEYMIRTYSNPDDTVLDFCMGSGTTCLASRNEGRNSIGIEKDPEYFRIASERVGFLAEAAA